MYKCPICTTNEEIAHKYTPLKVKNTKCDGLKQMETFCVNMFFFFALNLDLFHPLKTLNGLNHGPPRFYFGYR